MNVDEGIRVHCKFTVNYKKEDIKKKKKRVL